LNGTRAAGSIRTGEIRQVRSSLWTILTAAAACLVAVPACAQGKLDARYVVTLAGFPISKGAWVIDISGDQFTAAASGTTAGLLRAFSRVHGSGAVRGPVVAGKPMGATFAASITADKKTEEIRILLASGVVKQIEMTPPMPPNPECVPVTETHLRGVADPISSTLFKVPPQANMLGPGACPSIVPVFDGRMRFDVRLAYKRIEHARAERGYDGPAVVCAPYFTPIAGYVPSRSALKYPALGSKLT